VNPEDMRNLMTCFHRHNGCEAQPIWVVEWRKDYYDPYLTGKEGTIAASPSCAKHLDYLIELIKRDFDGHMHLMSTEFYVFARVQKREATSGEGLGAAWRWPRSVTKP